MINVFRSGHVVGRTNDGGNASIQALPQMRDSHGLIACIMNHQRQIQVDHLGDRRGKRMPGFPGRKVLVAIINDYAKRGFKSRNGMRCPRSLPQSLPDAVQIDSRRCIALDDEVAQVSAFQLRIIQTSLPPVT